MRYLIILLLAASAYVASAITIDHTTPADGATEVARNTAVSWVFPAGEVWDSTDVDSFRIAHQLLIETGVKTDTTLCTVTYINHGAPHADPDCVSVARTRLFEPYFEISSLLSWDSGSFIDSVTFRTAGTHHPFLVIPAKQWWDSTTATGRVTLTIVRPYGSWVWMADTAGTEYLIVQPDDVYATERTRQKVTYSLSSVPSGYSVYSFWAVSETDTSTDTLKLPLYYQRSTSGRHYGTPSR